MGSQHSFAVLPARLLPCGFLRQVTDDRAAAAKCSGRSNTVAMNRRVDFPEKKLAHW